MIQARRKPVWIQVVESSCSIVTAWSEEWSHLQPNS
jgi:hypothetical protein